MPRPLLIFSQSGYLIQIVVINLHTWWQTVQIQISWLLQKPTDLDLHCLQNRIYPGSAGQGLIGLIALNSFSFRICNIFTTADVSSVRNTSRPYIFLVICDHCVHSGILTHICPRPIKGTLANTVDPNQTPQNAASDQGLHCLHWVQKFL